MSAVAKQKGSELCRDGMTNDGDQTMNTAQKETYKVALAESSSNSTSESLTTGATSPLTNVMEVIKRMTESISLGKGMRVEWQKRMADSKECGWTQLQTVERKSLSKLIEQTIETQRSNEG